MFDIIKPDLRPYQVDVRDRVRALVASLRAPVRVILQASTGAGKSVIGLDLLLRCHERGKRAMFVVSGRTLVNQFEGYLARSGAPYGVIMAGRGWKNAPIQLASKETLAARAVRRQVMELPPTDLLLIDEAHESTAKEWKAIMDHYENAVIIGLTATPAYGNGKGLGKDYNGLEMAVSTKQLVSEGWLVPCRVFAPEKPDLSGIKIEKGDYNRIQLSERMDRAKITGSVLENWKRYAEGRKTVVFGCTIAHAKHLCDEFNAAGIPFRHVDQETPDGEREEIFGLIEDGKMTGFTNVSVARRGLDLPCLSCACVVRPTKSLVLWLQMIGRIRRPAPGKTDCVIIDHAGACDHHCMPDEEIEWSLDSKSRSEWLDKQKEEGKIEKTFTCPACACLFQGRRCPNCGYMLAEPPKVTKPVEHAPGILVERNGVAETLPLSVLQRGWDKALAIACNRNQKVAAAAHIFKGEFGVMPWTVKGLQKMPKRRKGAWQEKASEAFPEFLGRQQRA